MASGLANSVIASASKSVPPSNPFSTSSGVVADYVSNVTRTANNVFSNMGTAASGVGGAGIGEGTAGTPNFTSLANSLISSAVNVLSHISARQQPPSPRTTPADVTGYEEEIAMHAAPTTTPPPPGPTSDTFVTPSTSAPITTPPPPTFSGGDKPSGSFNVPL